MANKTINSLAFGSDTHIFSTPYGTCSTAAGTAAKTVTISNFALESGAKITIKFTYANTVASPTLNVNSTGAKAIYWRGSALPAKQYWTAGAVLDFVYNGTQWDVVGLADISTLESLVGTTSVASQIAAAAYSHPTTSGNKHIPSGGSSGQILRWSADGTAVWGADNNTTYSVVSTTADGLAPKRDGSTTKYLRADGTWAVPPDNNTDTKVNTTLATTTKAYLLGTSTTPTSTAQAVTTVADTGVYLDTTAGQLVATKFKGALDGNATSATKATQDGSGNTITSTYATKTALTAVSDLVGTKSVATQIAESAYTHPSYTARTGVPAANATLTYGGTFTVTQPVSDATGHITGMNTRTYTMPSDRLFTTLVPTGTAIPANADFNSQTYLKVGRYYCGANTTVKTLKNCPVTTYDSSGAGTNGTAFMMEVYSPLSTTIDNEATGTWTYRTRVLTTYTGLQYIQSCYTDGTAGNWIYGTWMKMMSCTKDTQVGGVTQPVYLNKSGNIAACTYKLEANVPSDAKFTDTTYSNATTSAAGLMSAADKTTLDNVNTRVGTTSVSTQISNAVGAIKYAGASTAGGSATSAVKLDTSTAGSATQPAYFTGGKPTACTYSLGASVPSGAKFTDTVTTASTSGSGNAVTAVTASNGALTVTKGDTFVNLSSAQTVSGVKTFSNGIKIGSATVNYDSTQGALVISF